MIRRGANQPRSICVGSGGVLPIDVEATPDGNPHPIAAAVSDSVMGTVATYKGRQCPFAVTRQTVTVKISSFEQDDRYGARRAAKIGQVRTHSGSKWSPDTCRSQAAGVVSTSHPITPVLQVCSGGKLSLFGRQRYGVSNRSLECHGAASRPLWTLRPRRGFDYEYSRR